ncbi:unnamed protein product [Cyclocybe aegerita]|uniref:non-specific serine/threonine protein kinase n=1 Tax=Cyclocybe aegerita TaxID=1973307 RepID=A0A8S0VQ36_CYCAE|nr:unnamed protein product [Cyclocybe aegerita]
MTNLHIKFPSVWPGWNMPECTLTSVPQSETYSLPSSSSPRHKYDDEPKVVSVTVDPKVHTDYCSDSPVFRGFIQDDPDDERPYRNHNHTFVRHAPPRLSSSDSSSSEDDAGPATTVALKFAMRDDFIADLVEEAQVYAGPLATLQGRTVPRCYGLFVAENEDGQTIACLVLEHWGEVIRKPFRQLPIETRIRVLERLGEIHRQGLVHGDFAERNVLQNTNGDIRIIDFDQAVYDHDCKGEGARSGAVWV